MLVVVPQVEGNAPNENRNTSTTSTDRVDNSAGEFVVEPVPLPRGGPSTSTPADDQNEASEHQEDDDHEEGQHQLGDESSLSKREAAIVTGKKVYGGDPTTRLRASTIADGTSSPSTTSTSSLATGAIYSSTPAAIESLVTRRRFPGQGVRGSGELAIKVVYGLSN